MVDHDSLMDGAKVNDSDSSTCAVLNLSTPKLTNQIISIISVISHTVSDINYCCQSCSYLK